MKFSFFHAVTCLATTHTCILQNTIALAFSPTIIHQQHSHRSISSRQSETETALKATWSNGQAIQEYQDFLASGKQEIEKKPDGPSVIVISAISNPPINFIAEAIAFMNDKKTDVIMRPGEPLPAELGDQESYPIYVAVPPNELDDFIKTLPKEWEPRREDFVFLSGGPRCGVIEPILKSHGFARDTMTQLLCGSFTTPDTSSGIHRPLDLCCKIGVDAMGETKWAGETAVCGKWAGAVQTRFESHQIRCKVGFYREWRRLMWERASFDAVFNLVGAVRDEPTTIKEVAMYYEPETSDMLWQVTGNLRGMLAVTLPYGFEERLFGFAETFSEQQCELSEEMFPYTFCPPLTGGNKIIEYLNYAKDVNGLIQNTALPRFDNRPSKMRQGNLRADGVV